MIGWLWIPWLAILSYLDPLDWLASMAELHLLHWILLSDWRSLAILIGCGGLVWLTWQMRMRHRSLRLAASCNQSFMAQRLPSNHSLSIQTYYWFTLSTYRSTVEHSNLLFVWPHNNHSSIPWLFVRLFETQHCSVLTRKTDLAWASTTPRLDRVPCVSTHTPNCVPCVSTHTLYKFTSSSNTRESIAETSTGLRRPGSCIQTD